MVNTLIINPGSSNVKFRLYVGDKIVFDEIIEGNNALIADRIVNKIKNYKVDKVAYRVVHGGDIKNHALITNKVLNQIKKVSSLAPLHNLPFLRIFEVIKKKIPAAKHIACFDTAFHRTMPDYARIYAIPEKFTKKYKIQRYGFHGLAHQYMAEIANKSGVITCQLGNGISITAVKNGKSLDTSMGFTPLEGCVMGTRSGNIDPSLVAYLAKKEGKSADEIVKMLDNKSGLKGIANENDVRKLLKRKDARAKLALDILIYNIRKQIGAYTAVLGKVDLIVLGGGIAQSKKIVDKILSGFKTKHLIVETDEQEVMFRISKRF